MFDTFHCGSQGMGHPLDGHEECISLRRSLRGDIYGATPGICAGFIFVLSTEEVSLWTQEGTKGMVCQDGLLPVVTKFVRCKSDLNVYMLRTTDSLILIVLYVDDLLITNCSTSTIVAVKRILHDRFLMMDMGPLHFYLGL
jgi:hypothetical protein